MRIRGFATSLVFGAIAALSLILIAPLLAQRVGFGSSASLYVAGCLVVYAVLLGRNARERLRNGGVASAVAALVLACANDGVAIAIGLTAGLALVRTGLDARLRSPRGWLQEGVLGCAALAFAGVLLSPGVLGGALALWGFALVQSLFCLLPHPRDAASRAEQGDAFERARAQLLTLLDEA